jgi:hypothetical protein
MAQEAKVSINIASLFTGKKAFKEAETATQKLTKSAKNLAGALGIAFGTRAVVNFAKVSLKAFQESEAQQQRLARLLEVTNDASAAQIAVLTRQANALEQLGVVSAGSITQVQSQLATFDLQILTINKLTPAILDYVTAEKGAAATADDFKAATNGLAQALNGNFASLTKTGFVLDDVTKQLISTGTESERAAAIVKVLDSTYKGFNRSLRDTPAGQFQILANSADAARVIIGEGLTNAIKSAFGGGDIEKASSNLKDMAQVVADIVAGLGTMTGALVRLVQTTDKFTLGRFFENRIGSQSSAPFDPMAMKAPDLTPAFMQLVKAQEKSDALALKRKKEATKELNKQTKAMKEQARLAKAKAVLDKADSVFNMELIQNTAALLGKVTPDETLRLKLQQAILLENSKVAGELSQQLLGAQIDAIILSNTDPFGNWTDGAANALAAMIKLREEMGKLTKPVLTAGEQLLAQDFAAVILNQNDPEILAMEKEIRDGMAALSNLPKGGMTTPNTTLAGLNYQDDIFRRNPSTGALNVIVSIDPNAAAYGINAAVVDANANGSASTVNRNGFFEYGR